MVFGELMVIFRFPIVLFPNVAMVFSALLDSVIPDPPSIIELDVDMELCCPPIITFLEPEILELYVPKAIPFEPGI